MAARVTVKFGTDSATKEYDSTDQLLADGSLQTFFGYERGRVVTSVNGAEYSGPLRDGDTVVLTTRQNTKGSK